MDKGIRPYCNNKFVELNEQRRRGLLTNTVFRKSVMSDCMEQFGITLASAATHYNHAFKHVKELNAELVDGLGRAEDKKGGRKPKVVAVPELCGPVQPPADADTDYDVALVAPQTVFNVCKKADGTVVAEGLCLEDARELVAKAAAAKKAKLYFV